MRMGSSSLFSLVSSPKKRHLKVEDRVVRVTGTQTEEKKANRGSPEIKLCSEPEFDVYLDLVILV